jgi:hypothetical protein
MDSIDVKGLPKNRVKFLQELIALWKEEETQESTPAFKKISKADLPPLPDWWQEALEEAKDSPLAHMSEEEIGQWTEKLAERGAQNRLAQQAR